MNALETLTAVTGCEPNERHKIDAHHYDGLRGLDEIERDMIASASDEDRARMT